MKKFTVVMASVILLMAMTVNVFAISYGDEWAGYVDVDTEKYSDVPRSHWAYDAVVRTSEKNWFGGYPDGSFRPNDSITRAEALKVFVVFLGLDYQNVDLSDLTYSDVSPNNWYAAYVEAGKDLFPVHTTIQGKTPFNPDMPVTREDTIYALVKALGCDIDVKYPDQSVLNMFKDAKSISGNIKSTFSIALMHELVSGFPDGTIRAQAALTRAEFATLLLRGTEHGFHDKYVAKISSVTVSPASPVEIEIGESVILSARALYTDGTNQVYSDLQPYDVKNNGVISLTGTTITGLKEGTTTIKYNDSYLKKDSLTVVVKKPTDAPTLKIYDYDDITTEETMQISGKVTDHTGTRVDLTCNNRDVNVSGENFSYTAKLNVGRNELIFVATNEYGNESVKTIVIIREEEKPTTVNMVNVVGKNEGEATNKIEGIGLKVKTEYIWDENVERGTVLSQSVSEGEEIEIGKTVNITVSGGKNEWVGWTDSLPSYVNGGEYVVEEKTQYRYKTLEQKDSTSPSLGGWTLEDESESWGSWSSWSRSSVNSTSTREVETKSVADAAQYKTQWHYTRYYGWDPNKKAYVSWPWKGTYSTTYQESGWVDSPYENRGRADAVDATCYKNTADSISVWWWNETTRQVELPRTYHTEYRYRDKNITYHYSRWSDWSEWSDNAVSGSGEKEVETKTVYRYKFK